MKIGPTLLRSRNKGLSVSLVAMAALILPASAHAAELYTSPLWADSNDSFHACNVVNVLKQPLLIKVEILNYSGVAIATSGLNDIIVPAGHSIEVRNGDTYSGFAYCHIDLGSAPVTDVRANLSVFYWTGYYYDTIAHSEAR